MCIIKYIYICVFLNIWVKHLIIRIHWHFLRVNMINKYQQITTKRINQLPHHHMNSTNNACQDTKEELAHRGRTANTWEGQQKVIHISGLRQGKLDAETRQALKLMVNGMFNDQVSWGVYRCLWCGWSWLMMFSGMVQWLIVMMMLEDAWSTLLLMVNHA